MSLTSHIKGSDKGPIHNFFNTQISKCSAITKQIKPFYTKAIPILPEKDVNWSTVGTAIDFRFRYYLENTHYKELIAWHGACRLSSDVIDYRKLDDGTYSSHIYLGPNNPHSIQSFVIIQFFEELQNFIDSITTVPVLVTEFTGVTK